ncbi:hypothetical protein FY034_06205 [Trichlorobacter lovleyi]|uniref:hypothetical protein n=1 Tax=Trichlorobacter lovleyi TaxID=313985 RepID=UPI00223FB913|nr:hypothetical protein [Trichlorobacter lovleyi]QOX78538.1 hypothetical protein FY034_06205 [Trichlorobacter lovleyi]
MRSSKSIMTGVAVLAALALPMVAGAANKLVVRNAGDTSDAMVVTDTGVIGIGTSTPNGGAIHVKASTLPGNVIKVEGNEVTNGAGFLAYHIKSDATLPGYLNRLGFMYFGSQVGFTTVNAGGLSTVADTQWTTTSAPASFLIETTGPTGFSREPRMRISSNGNVGIGNFTSAMPTQKLEVQGGLRLATTSAKPNCSIATRGTMWFSQGGTGVADTLGVCAKDSSGNYAWRVLY